METKSTTPRFEEVYRQHEFAPLTTLSMITANRMKKHRTGKSTKHRTADIEGKSKPKNQSPIGSTTMGVTWTHLRDIGLVDYRRSRSDL